MDESTDDASDEPSGTPPYVGLAGSRRRGRWAAAFGSIAALIAVLACLKSAVKSQGSTLDRRWKLLSWSTVGAEGISGGAVKCVEIGKNTNGESTLLGRH